MILFSTSHAELIIIICNPHQMHSLQLAIKIADGAVSERMKWSHMGLSRLKNHDRGWTCLRRCHADRNAVAVRCSESVHYSLHTPGTATLPYYPLSYVPITRQLQSLLWGACVTKQIGHYDISSHHDSFPMVSNEFSIVRIALYWKLHGFGTPACPFLSNDVLPEGCAWTCDPLSWPMRNAPVVDKHHLGAKGEQPWGVLILL